jgi:hypothetical protein
VAWVLFDLFSGGISLTRYVSPSRIYTLQAISMLHGHLWVKPGGFGIEGFVVHGKTFTEFGLFPSILRLPFVAVLGGRSPSAYTAPSMAVAWLLTATMAPLLLWRLRIMLRGSGPVSRLEALCSGLLIATLLGGSTLVYLCAQPWVFSEDKAWSIALAISCCFFLVGMIERATWGRVIGVAILVLAAELTRATTGLGLAAGAIGIGIILLLKRDLPASRAKAIAVITAGVFAALVAAFVTEIKFGIPFGLPFDKHVWTSVNAHRRAFLAAHGGQFGGPDFVPSTLLAYLQPFGIRINGTFPFFWLPGQPATRVGGVPFDWAYPTASIPSSMPLMTVLGATGIWAVIRGRTSAFNAGLRITLVALAVPCVALFFWGYIATRYLADFTPLLFFASAIGLIKLLGRVDGAGVAVRRAAAGLMSMLALLSMAINVGLAMSPTEDWSATQASNFVETQRSLSITPLSQTVHVVDRLPRYAPIGSLWATRECSGLYLSTGTDYSTVPGKALQHAGMQPVERSSSILHDIKLRFGSPLDELPKDTTLMRWGRTKLVLHIANAYGFYLVIENPDRPDVAWPEPRGGWTLGLPHRVYAMTVATDPNLHSISVFWKGTDPSAEGLIMLDRVLLGSGPAVVEESEPGAPIRVIERPYAGSEMALCRSLVSASGR